MFHIAKQNFPHIVVDQSIIQTNKSSSQQVYLHVSEVRAIWNSESTASRSRCIDSSFNSGWMKNCANLVPPDTVNQSIHLIIIINEKCPKNS